MLYSYTTAKLRECRLEMTSYEMVQYALSLAQDLAKFLSRQTNRSGLRLFHSQPEKATPWPLPLKLEFDPYPWYLITPASYLSTNWNSDRDSKNHPVSSSDSTTSCFFGCGKVEQAILQFIYSTIYNDTEFCHIWETTTYPTTRINCNNQTSIASHRESIKAN